VKLFDAVATEASLRQNEQGMSNIEHLTGLLNRAAFEGVVAAVCRRQGDSALVMADVDHFKKINDSHDRLATPY
jgi:GGDEF domain-containing protein